MVLKKSVFKLTINAVFAETMEVVRKPRYQGCSKRGKKQKYENQTIIQHFF